MSKTRILYFPFRLATCWKKPMCYFTRKCSYNAQFLDLRPWNNRISELIRFGRFNEAQSLFDKMSVRNTITWNSMIKGYVKNGEISKARKVFDEMPERYRDVISWNLMISGYVTRSSNGMRLVEEGKYLFDQMPNRDLVSWNTMISGFARVGRMEDALQLFRSMPQRDLITWNIMVSGFLRNGDCDQAIEWFRKMPLRDAPSLRALVLGLIRINECDKAKEILIECKGDVDGNREDLVHTYNTLIAGYGQRGRVDEARKLFDQIPCKKMGSSESIGFERNLVTWNSMIMSYVKVGDLKSARELFDQMEFRDVFSWNTMINGYVQALDMEQAKHLFSQMPNPDIMSWNIMVFGYAQSGNLELALNFFFKAPKRNLISWNTVISGCDKNGDYERAIELFLEMQVEEVGPDKHTLCSVLSACTGIGALDLGRQIHQIIIKTIIPDIPINNSLVTIYSRCGAIDEARTMFDEMGNGKDVISWNAIIGGYASHGFETLALELFEEMKRLKVGPTIITFVSVLNACAHAGLLTEGRKYFESMISDFGIEPRVEHYAALINILGRHGYLKEAMDLINSMPCKPNKTIWGALLGACRIHNNVELGQVASEALSKVEPKSSVPYILLHNMFIHVGQWEDAKKVKNAMDMNYIRKGRASSWLDCTTSRGYS